MHTHGRTCTDAHHIAHEHTRTPDLLCCCYYCCCSQRCHFHQILGRAKDISDFIKHGSESGYVEIELKGQHNKNTTIRRDLHKDNRSEWKLNGNTYSHHTTHITPNQTTPHHIISTERATYIFESCFHLFFSISLIP